MARCPLSLLGELGVVAVVPPEKEDKHLLQDPAEPAANESVIKCASRKAVFKDWKVLLVTLLSTDPEGQV